MDSIDSEIRRRLDKLKEPMQQVPSEEELHAKLRALKDLPTRTSSSISNKYVLLPKPLSNAEQVENLMKQFTDEAKLQDNYTSSTSVDEIEKRLQKLKANDHHPKPVQSNSMSTQPRESDTKILLKKILAEASLEKKTEQEFPHLAPQFSSKNQAKEEKMDFSDSDEEFCTICDKSPKWICLECNKHLFCARCFNEYHDDMEEFHQKKRFVRQRRRSTDSDEYSD